MQQNAHSLSKGEKAGGDVAAYGTPFLAMVLDSLGTVRYCHADAARLFRAGAHTIVGRHVSELIPALPFNSRTPAYNVAYATFWAPEGPRRGFCGVDSQGRCFDLQVALDKLQLEKHHQILLSLQLPVISAQLPEQSADSGKAS